MDYLGMLLWLDDGMEEREPQRGITINPCEEEIGEAVPSMKPRKCGGKEKGEGEEITKRPPHAQRKAEERKMR